MSFKILIFCTNEQNLLRVEMAELLLFWQQLTGISCTFPPFKAPFKMYRSTSEMMPSGLDDLEVLINVTQKEVKNNDKRNCIYKLTLSLLVLKVTKSVYKQENNKLTVTGSCWQRASNKDRGLVSYCPDTLTKEQKKKKENNRKIREKTYRIYRDGRSLHSHCIRTPGLRHCMKLRLTIIIGLKARPWKDYIRTER